MKTTCTRRRTAGGKGNKGMFIERDPNVCAAGAPTRSAQAEQTVASCFRYYSLQDEVEALINDSIKPDLKPYQLPPLKHQPKDVRNVGMFTETKDLINPPIKTKFQTLVEDLKNTVYSSYWKQRVGATSDPAPNLPEGFDFRTTFGKKTPDHGRLYDIVMPKIQVPDKTPVAKQPAYQTERNYCRSFNPHQIFGKRNKVDSQGKTIKCCLTDDRIQMGLLNMHLNNKKVDLRSSKEAQLAKALAPNDNISNVPPGHSFGINKSPDNLPECLTNCKMNPERQFLQNCLRHLNTLRITLKKRFDKQYFADFYLKMKYFDKIGSGWLPKEFVYDFCSRRCIRFSPLLLEPLLATFNAFDGAQVEYKTFVKIINYAEPTPMLPKVWDIPDDCIDFRTTYSESFKPDQEPNKSLMAGLPSGRYLDLDYPITPNGCCKADRVYFPQESDAWSCLCPSVFTLFGITHRDMFAKRTPEVVRKVFEATGEKFTDEKFETVWNKAKKEHSQEWVCYETFRRALDRFNSAEICKNR